MTDSCAWTVTVSVFLLTAWPSFATAGHTTQEPAERASTPQCTELNGILEALGRDYSIELIHEPDAIPAATWRLEIEGHDLDGPDLPHLLRFARIFDHEFRKYPKEFVQKSALKAVVFGKDLVLQGQARAAMPEYFKEILYLDVAACLAGGSEYARHVIHHEYYHLLEEQWNGSVYYKDPAWAALNPEGFTYGKGGRYAQTEAAGVLNHPRPGFLNAYAMSGLEEDKAEVWAVLFVHTEWKRIEPWLEDDERLRAKVEYLEAFARKQHREMKGKYWTRVRAAPK